MRDGGLQADLVDGLRAVLRWGWVVRGAVVRDRELLADPRWELCAERSWGTAGACGSAVGDGLWAGLACGFAGCGLGGGNRGGGCCVWVVLVSVGGDGQLVDSSVEQA
ncbi:hypothetical protein GCM10009804_34290 [Kribbella hippodromi]|uniref:Uncharacterized protein n=1 Tax=Kribbella hippodromi TaxID=434347 RepID=A0ABP4PBM1_9ACTN